MNINRVPWHTTDISYLASDAQCSLHMVGTACSMALYGQTSCYVATELKSSLNDTCRTFLEMLRNYVCIWRKLLGFQKEYKYQVTQETPPGKLLQGHACAQCWPNLQLLGLEFWKLSALVEVMSTKENGDWL